MKLNALIIKNFKGISSETKVLIDNVVILIGRNNCCKSTVLDAYEAYHSIGSARSIDDFHNRDESAPIEITGVFVDITQDDIDTIGREWHITDDPDFGECAKFKVVWSKADESGKKYSFSNKVNDWKEGGAGGWNTMLASRLPTPIRINPNDSPSALEQIVKDLIASNALKKIKADKSKVSKILGEIQVLAKEIEVELDDSIKEISQGIEDNVESMFNGLKVRFETGVGKFEPEKAIKEGSRFYFETNGNGSPLTHQGSGVQRAFLWASIKTLSSRGMLKKGKTAISSEKPKILLIDEPEMNMHPSVIRSVSEAIYSLSEMSEWQILCTTHSPIFIDLTNPHTTLIRVSNENNKIGYFQTDKISFSDIEKDNIKTLVKCCPTVNEFFFYENAFLVEGDTEFLAYQHLISAEKLNHKYCVINCRGKANIPTFIKIFNQFESRAIAVHDLDEKFNDDGKKNAMWSINYSIRKAADDTGERVKTLVHYPDFEGFYFGEKPTKDKPYNLFKHITNKDYDVDEKYDLFRSSLKRIEDGTHSGLYDSEMDFKKRWDDI
ncbi:ATP-dependent nuclease [Cedecea sp.]|jgi:hypothetical protein|uniref:ATP-dependent nuclease n=1 Tax=Cedecea sp. TaxID=1970739 RepID=UPI002F416459